MNYINELCKLKNWLCTSSHNNPSDLGSYKEQKKSLKT